MGTFLSGPRNLRSPGTHSIRGSVHPQNPGNLCRKTVLIHPGLPQRPLRKMPNISSTLTLQARIMKGPAAPLNSVLYALDRASRAHN